MTVTVTVLIIERQVLYANMKTVTGAWFGFEYVKSRAKKWVGGDHR